MGPLAELFSILQLSRESAPFSQAIPPPRALSGELTSLFWILESAKVALPPVVLMPPPLDVAVLFSILLLVTARVPALAIPPPARAEFFLTLPPDMVSEPRALLWMPPPSPVAVLPLTVQSFIAVVAEKE